MKQIYNYITNKKIIRALILLLIFSIILSSFSSFSYSKDKIDLPVLFENNGLYGFKNKKGETVIKPIYPLAVEFNGYGIAFVLNPDTNKFDMINASEKKLVEMFMYDNGPDYFEEGLSRYVEKGKIGFVDEKGKIAIPASFEFAYPFKNGFARIVRDFKREQIGEHEIIKEGKWGFINKKGVIVVPCIYDNAEDFDKDGTTTVELSGKWITIHKKEIMR